METTKQPWSGQSGWHVADWGPWGWAETVVKLVAIVVAVGAAIDDGATALSSGHRLSYWLLFAVAVGYIGSIFDRLTDKEIVSMGFVVLMLIGHWCAVYAMGRADFPSGTVRLFAGLMLVGDVIKLGFFATTKASVRGLPWTIPFAMTSTLAVAYAIAAMVA